MIESAFPKAAMGDLVADDCLEDREPRRKVLCRSPGFMANLRKRSGVAPRAMEFDVLTTARSGEARSAVWAGIDIKERVWTILADRMKASRTHEVPLSGAALAILADLPSFDGNGHVFAGSGRAWRMSENALLNVLKRMDLGHLPQHGLRSSFRDWADETASHLCEVMEHALAHRLKDRTEATFQSGTYFPKRRVLKGEWSGYCGSRETPP